MADGEDPGLDPALVEAHLSRCRACRTYRDHVHELRRMTFRAAPRLPDLSARVAKLDRLADRASRWAVARGLLVVVALQIIGLSVPALVLGDERATSPHVARHLGAFTIAYGVALLVVAARPARARTVLPVAYVLAGALAITAVVDIVDGQIPLAGEALHLPELMSVVLIWLLAVPAPRRPAGGDAVTGQQGPAVTLVRSDDDESQTGRHAS
jgi:predicted anti-sigma-YlaC factor YlaD